MPKILIDYEQCEGIAKQIVLSGGVPKDEEDPMPLSFPTLIAMNAWCAVVSICHQTTPVDGIALVGLVGGVLRKGWDYLLQKSIEKATMNPSFFSTPWLCRVSGEDLRALYHDDIHGDTLNRTEERAELLRELGDILNIQGWSSVHECYLRAEGYIIHPNRQGIADTLTTIRAFSDPVRKKLFYFLALMQNQGFWRYKDPEHLSSPVNYHEQRGHFRLGSVRITNAELERKIRARENITAEEDIEIRLAVRTAIEFIATQLQVTPPAAHYFFWNYFRNCCGRDAVHCERCGDECKLPTRYRKGQSKCVLAPACASRGLPMSEMLIEPRLDDTIFQ